MRVFPNYAKDLDYASAIYKGLHKLKCRCNLPPQGEPEAR